MALKMIEFTLRMRGTIAMRAADLDLRELLAFEPGGGVIRFANEQFAAFFGSTVETLVGTRFGEAAKTEEQREAFGSPSEYTPETPLRSREICYVEADGRPNPDYSSADVRIKALARIGASVIQRYLETSSPIFLATDGADARR